MLHNLRHHQSQDNGTLMRDAKRQESGVTKVPRRRSSGLKFFASSAPTSEIFSKSHKRWEADYLKDLRDNRPVRPGGSRPLLSRGEKSPDVPENRAATALSFRPASSIQPSLIPSLNPARSTSALSHRRARSDVPAVLKSQGEEDKSNLAKHDDATQDSKNNQSAAAPTPSNLIREGNYRESGLRWMERQEAKSLRAALEDMDSMEEVKAQAAAKAEALKLVQEHQSGDFQIRRPNKSRNYRDHLEKGAHARSLSQVFEMEDIRARNPQPVNHEPELEEPDSPKNGGGSMPEESSQNRQSINKKEQQGGEQSSPYQGHALWDSPERKAYLNMTFPMPLPKPSGRRKSSGPRVRNSSGGLFRNPEDKIYEEPQEASRQVKWADTVAQRPEAVLAAKTRNVVSNVQTKSEPHLRSLNAENPLVHRAEIHKNPPSRSRDPSYVRNEAAPDENTSDAHGGAGPIFPSIESKEIRSDEIRAATSRKMKDRSQRLPHATVTSDRPGRPIISFEPVPNERDGGVTHNEPGKHSTEVKSFEQNNSPPIPIINVPEEPSIQVKGPPDGGHMSSMATPQVPDISITEETPRSHSLAEANGKQRSNPVARLPPQHSSLTPTNPPKTHWSAVSSRTTTQCASCALPIAGRIVSAAGERLHPQCFTCHHCEEALECVAFYPEPERLREERIARIQARLGGNCIPEEKPGQTAEDDGDESLRFFCHLDFHESFSPRCKSCKTPIEKEVVVACGSTWHVGHFFCAECGDPFDANTPFVEKSGYAWCVQCHVGRFSGKCKGCRKPVVTEGIRALGAEWHEACFVCVVSDRHRGTSSRSWSLC